MINYEHYKPVKVRQGSVKSFSLKRGEDTVHKIWSIGVPATMAAQLRLRRGEYMRVIADQGGLRFLRHGADKANKANTVKVRAFKGGKYPKGTPESYETHNYSLGIPPALAKELGLERGMLMRPMIKRGGVLVYMKEVAK